ncbi:hypothetical protein BRD06_10225 [Halobacteriales archaeon QS_9_67_15]|nr:MAG: hypothetical protein BRD06_10225 [Halobacteriales archaeon QS_9_67_15]
MILPAVSLSRISPPRGGEYLHEVTAGSMSASPPGTSRGDSLAPLPARRVRVGRSCRGLAVWLTGRFFPPPHAGVRICEPSRSTVGSEPAAT